MGSNVCPKSASLNSSGCARLDEHPCCVSWIYQPTNNGLLDQLAVKVSCLATRCYRLRQGLYLVPAPNADRLCSHARQLILTSFTDLTGIEAVQV